MSKPLRRTRRDLIATGVIAGVSALLVGTAVLTAPVRHAELTPAAEEQQDYGQLAVVPSSLSEGFRLTDTSGQDVPLTEAQQAEEAAKEGEWYSTLWESVEGSSRLTPEDIPDETGSTDEDVPAEDPADTTDQDDDQ